MAGGEIGIAMNSNDRYPLSLKLGDDELVLRLMNAADEQAILAFARDLPAHDLLYVQRDVSNPKVVAAWVRAVDDGTATTVVALRGQAIVGCGALFRDPLSWSPHLGEVRVLVAESMRHKGLGRLLIQQCFLIAVEAGLRKLVAQMTVDQQGAVAIFEDLGFRGEALLKEHVLDRDGVTHDIVILSCDVDRVHSQMAAYGIDSAL